VLSNTKVKCTGEEGLGRWFSPFRDTLTCLSLYTFAAPFSVFVTLLDYFPNIATLQLSSIVLEPDGRPIPSLSRPLRGKLNLREVGGDHLESLIRFGQLDLEYEELVLCAFYHFTGPGFLESALRICPRAVKSLRLAAEFLRE
jgi:hypothetical protein